MLVAQQLEEALLELLVAGIVLAGDRDGLALARGGVFLYEVLDLIVVEVVCRAIVLVLYTLAAIPTSIGGRRGPIDWHKNCSMIDE